MIVPGTLQSSRQSDHISDSIYGYGVVFRNRTGIQEGDIVTMSYQITHFGDNVENYMMPLVTWLKDGEVFRTPPRNSPKGHNGRLNTVLSFTMTPSDGGVYQCVITDPARSEVLVTGPIRLEISKA